MSVKAEMEKILQDALQPETLVLRNDSDRHIGHAGHDGSGESHFHLVIVSEKFHGLSRLDRQRLVHGLLSGYLHQRIHALSMDLKSPAEGVLKSC